jgi:hypothetical protein
MDVYHESIKFHKKSVASGTNISVWQHRLLKFHPDFVTCASGATGHLVHETCLAH